MARLKVWWPFALVAVAIVLWLGLSARSCVAQRTDAAASAQATQHNTAATIAASQGVVHDQAVEAQKPTLTADAAAVSRLQAEVARLRQALAHPVVPNPLPGVPVVEPAGGATDLAPLVAKQDELIQAQDQQIRNLQGQVVNLTQARDSWRAAALEREQEATAERIAHQAALSAAKAERWKGRIEGFVVGFGAGYLGGKF